MHILAPFQENTVVLPLMIGGEYAAMVADGKLVVRVGGSDTTIVLPATDSSEVVLPVPSMSVVEGTLNLIRYRVEVPTNLGKFTKTGTFYILDILDIPTDSYGVMALLGVSPVEVQEAEIDNEIINTYLNLYPKFPMESGFHQVRKSDHLINLKFGKLISLTTAINMVPRLANILEKSSESENGKTNRLGNASDLLTLQNNLKDQLQELKAELIEFIPETQEAVGEIFTVVPLFQPSIGA